jgi:hypothetical protein
VRVSDNLRVWLFVAVVVVVVGFLVWATIDAGGFG